MFAYGGRLVKKLPRDLAPGAQARRAGGEPGERVAQPAAERHSLSPVGALSTWGSNPSFAAWEQNEPYTIALLIKGRSGGASTKHLYRSGSSSTAITFCSLRPAPRPTGVTRPVVAARSRSRRPSRS
jgi:hypothetical protein